MGLITVDAEKCTHCGTCLEECPFRLLEMKTESSLPAPKEIEVRSVQTMQLQADGELLGEAPARLHILPAALNVAI